MSAVDSLIALGKRLAEYKEKGSEEEATAALAKWVAEGGLDALNVQAVTFTAEVKQQVGAPRAGEVKEPVKATPQKIEIHTDSARIRPVEATAIPLRFIDVKVMGVREEATLYVTRKDTRPMVEAVIGGYLGVPEDNLYFEPCPGPWDEYDHVLEKWKSGGLDTAGCIITSRLHNVYVNTGGERKFRAQAMYIGPLATTKVLLAEFNRERKKGEEATELHINGAAVKPDDVPHALMRSLKEKGEKAEVDLMFAL
ncbi:Hypothetical protein POVN_LOCUS57 [uncultured virus]|nr:Hypothetical protein POVN_LOCUS57 [uncultured virus]